MGHFQIDWLKGSKVLFLNEFSGDSVRNAKKMVAKILAEDNPYYVRGPTESPEAWTGNHLNAVENGGWRKRLDHINFSK